MHIRPKLSIQEAQLILHYLPDTEPLANRLRVAMIRAQAMSDAGFSKSQDGKTLDFSTLDTPTSPAAEELPQYCLTHWVFSLGLSPATCTKLGKLLTRTDPLPTVQEIADTVPSTDVSKLGIPTNSDQELQEWLTPFAGNWDSISKALVGE